MFCLAALLTTLAFTMPPPKTIRTKGETSYHKVNIEKSTAVINTVATREQVFKRTLGETLSFYNYCKETYCQPAAPIKSLTLSNLSYYRRTAESVNIFNIIAADKITSSYLGYLKPPAWRTV